MSDPAGLADDEAVFAAIEKARCPNREGPYGLYDYTRYGRPVPHVVRDFRDMTMADYGATVFESHDHDEAERVFDMLTRQHIGMAAIKAIAALRAQTPDRGAGGRMREACARWHDERAAEYDREATERTMPDGSPAGRDAMWARSDAMDHRKHAAAIRSLPLATEGKR